MGSDEVVEITDSELYCYACFYPSENGSYFPGSKKVAWKCENKDCQKENVVSRELL